MDFRSCFSCYNQKLFHPNHLSFFLVFFHVVVALIGMGAQSLIRIFKPFLVADLDCKLYPFPSPKILQFSVFTCHHFSSAVFHTRQLALLFSDVLHHDDRRTMVYRKVIHQKIPKHSWALPCTFFHSATNGIYRHALSASGDE